MISRFRQICWQLLRSCAYWSSILSSRAIGAPFPSEGSRLRYPLHSSTAAPVERVDRMSSTPRTFRRHTLGQAQLYLACLSGTSCVPLALPLVGACSASSCLRSACFVAALIFATRVTSCLLPASFESFLRTSAPVETPVSSIPRCIPWFHSSRPTSGSTNGFTPKQKVPGSTAALETWPHGWARLRPWPCPTSNSAPSGS